MKETDEVVNRAHFATQAVVEDPSRIGL